MIASVTAAKLGDEFERHTYDHLIEMANQASRHRDERRL